MTLVWRPGILYDADALAYMELVKAADAAAGQTGGLEPGVVDAINDFVVGCKTDGIWSAIKASCILAGARTLAGALVPLVGTAPTKFGTEGGWSYNRETGLKGNGTDNYLNSNRNNATDPQNSNHLSVYATELPSDNVNRYYIGVGGASGTGVTSIRQSTGGTHAFRSRSATAAARSGVLSGLIAMDRSTSSSVISRANQISQSDSVTSETPLNDSVAVLATITASAASGYANARLAFYSIGESLDLAALDTRVTALITAIGAAIP